MNLMIRVAVAAGMVLCTQFAFSEGGAALWKVSDAMWRQPKTYPIPSQDKPGVKAMAVEGEVWQGRQTRFFAYWGLPAGASPERKVPGIVLVHGGSGTAFDDWVRTWTSRGYAAIAMDNCGGFPCRIKELGGSLRHAFSGPNGWGNFHLAGEPLRDQWTYQAVSTVIRSHSFLRTRPEVDPARIGITGISWGGYLTACVAGIDDRFAFAAPVYGCAHLADHSVWSEEIRKLGERGRRWDALWDAKNFLPSARIPVLWATGSNDRFFPLDSLQRGCDLLPESPRLVLRVRMPHGHPPAGDPKEIAAFADHFAFGRPALPEIVATRTGDRLTAKWNAFGRRIAKAELVYTVSSDPNWEKRLYETRDVPFQEDFLVCAIPSDIIVCWLNLVCEDGLVSSSRIFFSPL